MKKLLILGGTGDALQLAEQTQQIPGLTVISSLAGRTQQPVLPSGQLRMGGFGGEQGLVNYLRENSVDLLIDATHPFAKQITRHAAAAATASDLPFLIFERLAWLATPADRWLEVADHAAAAKLLPTLAQRIFLTIGRQEISLYAHLTDLWFLMRSIDPPHSDQLPPGKLLLAKGPFDLTAERAILLEHDIQVIVSKNSGGAATYAKIVAARELGLPVVMIQRPVALKIDRATTLEQAIEWLHRQLGYSTASFF